MLSSYIGFFSALNFEYNMVTDRKILKPEEKKNLKTQILYKAFNIDMKINLFKQAALRAINKDDYKNFNKLYNDQRGLIPINDKEKSKDIFLSLAPESKIIKMNPLTIITSYNYLNTIFRSEKIKLIHMIVHEVLINYFYGLLFGYKYYYKASLEAIRNIDMYIKQFENLELNNEYTLMIQTLNEARIVNLLDAEVNCNKELLIKTIGSNDFNKYTNDLKSYVQNKEFNPQFVLEFAQKLYATIRSYKQLKGESNKLGFRYNNQVLNQTINYL
ncbi:MAG: hypothetical protein J0H68_07925 [Sphingobacteriia bacterium]|nr:hypothetical protein [Sphingobacteriia bacterium]